MLPPVEPALLILLPMEEREMLPPVEPALLILLPMEEREMLLPVEPALLILLPMEEREMLLPEERTGEDETLLMFDCMLLLLNEEPVFPLYVEPVRLGADRVVLLLLFRFTVMRVELLVR